MAADTQGNDINAVNIPITGRMCFVPYDVENVIEPEMISEKVAVPTLPDAYKSGAVGLVESDGAPQDASEAGDPIEFWQQGYQAGGSSSITTAATLAEDNAVTRKLVRGGEEPDEHGVFGVDTLVPDTKWMAYYEEAYKNGRVYRRAGVVQMTGNEPGQSERGSVKGRACTFTWLEDENYGGHKYIEATYDPALASATDLPSDEPSGDDPSAGESVKARARK